MRRLHQCDELGDLGLRGVALLPPGAGLERRPRWRLATVAQAWGNLSGDQLNPWGGLHRGAACAPRHQDRAKYDQAREQ